MNEHVKWAVALFLLTAVSMPRAAGQVAAAVGGRITPHAVGLGAAGAADDGLISAPRANRHSTPPSHSRSDSVFQWPDGRKAALSLSFDDARTSQIDVGIPLLDRHGVKATFFVVPGAVEERLDGWRSARLAGHEIGNHSLNHPCSGNFVWARDKALEDYSLNQMREELEAANRRLQELLDVTPDVFAYPCGQTFVGRGVNTESYVPLVAEIFRAGRGWLDEATNDPAFVDPARIMALEMDGLEISELLPIIEQAKDEAHWIVLAGHEIGESGYQTTRVDLIEQIIRYAADPANEIWMAPVGTVADYVIERRNVDQ